MVSERYTVANAAKRIGCAGNTVLNRIHDGTFKDVILDTSIRGTPAYMINSEEVEEYIRTGQYHKRRASTMRKETVVRKVAEPVKETASDVVLVPVDSRMLKASINVELHKKLADIMEAVKLLEGEIECLEKWLV